MRWLDIALTSGSGMAEGSQATEFAAPDEQEPLDYDAFLSYTTAIADSGRNSEGFGSHRPLGAEQPQRNKRRRGIPVHADPAAKGRTPR
jgi:hypothetical protein